MAERELIEMMPAKCYVLIHIASHVLKENELKQILETVSSSPISFSTTSKTIRHIFLHYEASLTQYEKLNIFKHELTPGTWCPPPPQL